MRLAETPRAGLPRLCRYPSKIAPGGASDKGSYYSEREREAGGQHRGFEPDPARCGARGLADLDLYGVRIVEFDIEGTLSFAEHLVSKANRLWIQAGLDQRQRLQKVFFPEGVTFGGREFRTPLACPFFSNFAGTSGSSERLVGPTGFEPVLSP